MAPQVMIQCCHCSGMGLIPGPETSICLRNGKEKKKERNEGRKKERKKGREKEKSIARKLKKKWKTPMNHQNMLQLYKENDAMTLYSGNSGFFWKNISNVSNVLSCKKGKTPKNKHSKHAKKGLGIIKPKILLNRSSCRGAVVNESD